MTSELMMSGNFFFQSVGYWLSVIQKVNGSIKSTYDLANK